MDNEATEIPEKKMRYIQTTTAADVTDTLIQYGSVALTAVSQQKLHCLLFSQPTGKIVLSVTIRLRRDDEAVLFVSCGLIQYPPVSSALAETI